MDMDRQVQTVKVNAFRQFAATIFAQVSDQLCSEFEREVVTLTDDLVMYRTELARRGELLAMQLGREKQLHGMLENIAGNSHSLVANAQDVGKGQPGVDAAKDQMHSMLEQMFGAHQNVVSQTIGHVSEAHLVTNQHLAQAKELHNQALTAENELNRIMAILQQPPISSGSVAATVAQQPQYQIPMPGSIMNGGSSPSFRGQQNGMLSPGAGGMMRPMSQNFTQGSSPMGSSPYRQTQVMSPGNFQQPPMGFPMPGGPQQMRPPMQNSSFA